jgi:hypothetical protein
MKTLQHKMKHTVSRNIAFLCDFSTLNTLPDNFMLAPL